MFAETASFASVFLWQPEKVSHPEATLTSKHVTIFGCTTHQSWRCFFLSCCEQGSLELGWKQAFPWCAEKRIFVVPHTCSSSSSISQILTAPSHSHHFPLHLHGYLSSIVVCSPCNGGVTTFWSFFRYTRSHIISMEFNSLLGWCVNSDVNDTSRGTYGCPPLLDHLLVSLTSSLCCSESEDSLCVVTCFSSFRVHLMI